MEPLKIMGDWYHSAKMGDSGPPVVEIWILNRKKQMFQINDNLDLYILVIIISFVSLVSFLLIVSLKIEIDYILYFLNIVNQEDIAHQKSKRTIKEIKNAVQ